MKIICRVKGVWVGGEVSEAMKSAREGGQGCVCVCVVVSRGGGQRGARGGQAGATPRGPWRAQEIQESQNSERPRLVGTFSGEPLSVAQDVLGW